MELCFNIIHLPHRQDRMEHLLKQLEGENITDYKIWPGIMTKERRIGISLAHRRIVRDAKDKRLPMVLISEDDLRFTAKGAFKYFLSHIPEDFDIFLSSYYSGHADENFIIKKFAGLTMYIVHQRYYDTFLSASEKHHIDTALGMMGGKFVVCDKFVAIQSSGYSDQRRRFCDDSNRIKGKQIYNG